MDKLDYKKGLYTIIILLIVFLRFWKVPELFNFTFSEEIEALMAWEQVKNFHPIWIGVSAANINYYLGPGFVYFQALLLFISKGKLEILAYSAVILGLITTASVYYVVRSLFNKQIALYSVLFYGFSTLIQFHDRRFFNPIFVPFITIWLIYSLVRSQKDTRWLILTSILIGCSFHIHLTLLLFMAPTLYIVISNFKRIAPKTWIFMILCYLIITSPLIVYDLVHNFDNIRMPYRLLVEKSNNEVYSLNTNYIIDRSQYLFSSMGRLWFINIFTNPQDEIAVETHMNPTRASIFLSLLSLIAYFWFFIKEKNGKHMVIIVSLLVIPIAFILYPSTNSEYYLLGFFAVMAIVIGFWLNSLPRPISNIVLTFFILANILSVVTMSDKYGLNTRIHLIEKTMKRVQGSSFQLETIGVGPNPHFSNAGWRYLFKHYGRTPAKSNIDIVLGWIYPDEISKNIPEFKVIVADSIGPKFDRKPMATFESGPYKSYILKNN